ncbi:hypothetical protein [Parasediminibacterium sp. JCM 36343]|uniref:hypothetical protein n=1 Tax=Parasediminibacterium sp. JCM 36343 TaxID=3374279 RepID=UPI00397BE6B1
MKHEENLLAFITGIFAGGIRFLLNGNPNYPASLLQAATTALVCGAAGYVGKEIVVWIKKLWRK